MSVEERFLKIIKAIYNKATANRVVLNTETMKASPLRSQTKQACPLATFIQHSIGRSQTASDKRKEINLIQTEVK